MVPLELSAGLAEGATPALGYNVMHGYAQHDMRLHGEALLAAHRTPPPRATLERMAKRLATASHEIAPRIEATLRRVEALPEGAHAVCIGRELTARCVELPDAEQDVVMAHLIYIENNKDRMRYVTLSTSGLPIGSGVTESAAKTVVGRRAKNSGQRWSEPGLRGALTLRAIQQSDRLPRFWNHLSRRYTAVVAEAA